MKEDKESYLIEPKLRKELYREIIPKILFTTINRQGDLFLWPVRLPGEDGRLDNWNQSAIEAAELAKYNWIRLIPNMNIGAYEIIEATGCLPDPEWPELSFKEIMEIAFKDKLISDLQHPIIRRLRGEL